MTLDILIEKWRKVCQEAALRLLDSVNSRRDDKVGLGQMLNMLNLDEVKELIGYCSEDDWFADS